MKLSDFREDFLKRIGHEAENNSKDGTTLSIEGIKEAFYKSVTDLSVNKPSNFNLKQLEKLFLSKLENRSFLENKLA